MPVPSRQAFDSASAFVLCTMPAISESATVCKTATLSRPLRAAYVTGSQGFLTVGGVLMREGIEDESIIWMPPS